MPGTPKTFVGGLVAYATPQDYISRVDVNWTGDLAVDDGSRASPTALLTNPRLLDALTDASGDVEEAITVAERYDVADLLILQGNSLGRLKRMVCGLAVQYMREARGYMEESTYPLYKRAKDDLLSLAQGASIFPFLEVQQAGVAQTQRRFPSSFYADTPTLLPNNVRAWGVRANRRGGFPGGNFGTGFGNFGSGS